MEAKLCETKKNERLSWIDTLKGIACICVMASHTLNLCGDLNGLTDLLCHTILRPFFKGSLMVCLFAILSGYLTSRSIGKVKFLKSYCKRYLQIVFPIFFTGILVFIIQRTVGFASSENRELIGLTNDSLVYLDNLKFGNVIFQGLIGVLFLGQSTINPAFWMMRSLFFGSLFAILISFIIGKIQDRVWISYLAIIIAITISLLINDHIILAVILGFLIGYLKKNDVFAKLRKNKSLNLFIFIFSFLMSGWGHHFLYSFVNQNLFALPVNFDDVAKWQVCWITLFVFSLDNINYFKDRMSNKFIVLLGQSSMGIYCFHNIFIYSIGILSMKYFSIDIAISKNISYWISFMIVVILSCAFAILYEKFIGSRVNKLVRKITR